MAFRPARRRLLRAALAAVPALALPRLAAAAATPRELRFVNLHTGEKLTALYYDGGRYVDDALAAVDHVLRDFRTGDIHPIDPALLDLLHGLRATTGSRAPFQIISGYRSPATNRQLQRNSTGVATRSLHMDGRAIDVRLADVALPRLRRAAAAARAGGVGYYPDSGFVHLDTGRVRYW